MPKVETTHPKVISDPMITVKTNDRHYQFMVCHRDPNRSLIIAGKPILCWRCVGNYSILILLFTYQLLGILLGFFFGSMHQWYIALTGGDILKGFALIIILHLPMAIDGSLQAWKTWYESGTIRRLISGGLAGMGQALIFLMTGLLLRSLV